MYYFSFFVQNLPAERKWPEVNQHVVYPIKETLVRMENGLLIKVHDPVVQFCVSFITMNAAEVELKRVIGSWNSHSIDCVYRILVVSVAKNVLAQLAFIVVLTPTRKLIKYNYYNITTLLYFLGKDSRIPDVVARATRRIRPLTPTIVPSVQDAIQMYTNAGGVLTSECSFGNDPLADDGALRNSHA